jgi:hypothetical protein
MAASHTYGQYLRNGVPAGIWHFSIVVLEVKGEMSGEISIAR